MRFPVVYVRWVDSARGPDGWEAIDTIVSREPLEIESIGFVAHENEKHIILLQNYDLDNGTGNGLYSVSIPRVAILEMRPISEAVEA